MSIKGEALSVMRSTIILVLAVIRASGERRSGLICPTLRHPSRKMRAPCGDTVPSAEKLRYDRNAARVQDRRKADTMASKANAGALS